MARTKTGKDGFEALTFERRFVILYNTNQRSVIGNRIRKTFSDFFKMYPLNELDLSKTPYMH